MHIKVAIADDHPLVIDGLKNMLLRYPLIDLTGTYANGTELLQGLQSALPDVLILDIQMPGKTGDELAPVILKKYTDLKILTLTNFDSTLHANNMFKHGVHGYLLKNAEEKVIINAIETVYKGKQFIEEPMKEKMQQLQQKVIKTVSAKSTLSPREKEVLQLIVNGDSSQEIAGKLFLSLRTVENYRLNIMLKLDVKNTAMLVNKALKHGLSE